MFTDVLIFLELKTKFHSMNTFRMSNNLLKYLNQVLQPIITFTIKILNILREKLIDVK